MKTLQTGDRVLAVTLVVSLAFHLSAVSLFRIVIYFPRHDIEYFDVAIVDWRDPVRPLPFAQERLSLSSLEGNFEQIQLRGDPLEERESWFGLPDIQFPTVKFEELGLLRIRRQALETRARYDDLFEDAPSDTWSRFGRKLTSVSESFARYANRSTPERTPRPVLVSRPAPGYEAYLEWLSDPRDRETLSVQPIDALWGLDPSEFGDPIALVFRVDRDGKVVDVLDPVKAADGVLESSVDALMRYRFEPLLGEGPSTQHGTLIIRATGEDA